MKKLFIMALLLSAGCVRDGGEGAPGGDRPVRVSTRAAIGGTVDGLTLASVRIIAIDSSTGIVAFNGYRDSGGGSLGFEEAQAGQLTVGNFVVSLMPATYDFWAVVNELPSSGLGSVTTRAALDAITLAGSSLPAESAMVCVGGKSGVAITATSPGTLDIPVVRAATKLTVMMRKESDDPADSFSLTGASLSGLPGWSYLLPAIPFDGTLSTGATDVSPPAGPVTFTTNSEEYTEVVTGYIMPEYRMTDPADATAAIRLDLTADYTTAGGSTLGNTRWGVTLPRGGAATDFEMVRGTHYVVHVTIRRAGGFDYYIVYDVGKWDKVTDDPTQVTIGDNNYTIHRNWAADTVIEDGDNTARVRINGSVTMEFTMAQPASGRWTAQLSNPADFYFDTVEGVRSGIAREAFTNRIVVRPRGLVDGDVSTELYITIDNGVREIEWDLNQDGAQGPGRRYVIKQIPR